jgi:hypothetical protein
MHLMKNLYVNLLAFLSTYGKAKDTPQDLNCMKQRSALHPLNCDKGRHDLRHAYYTLSKGEGKYVLMFQQYQGSISLLLEYKEITKYEREKSRTPKVS